jgi:hypothetical protein
MDNFHLAQINIAQAKDHMESSTMQGFVSRLDEINAIADHADGFVWRLQTEEGDTTSIQAFEDEKLIVNMSVWQDVASLKHYVYKSMHVELIQDRDAWFDKIQTVHQALWWVPAGHIPSIEEGKIRLALLQKEGPSAKAFTFAKPFSQPSENTHKTPTASI